MLDPDIGQDCPICNAPMKVTISDVATNRTVTCPRGHRITFEDDNGGFGKADEAMNDLDKAIKNLGK